MANEDVMALLRSIDAGLKAVARMGGNGHGAPAAASQSRPNGRPAQSQQRPAQRATATVASDEDLDGQYGDPKLNFTPKDWTGDSFKGMSFSQCPAELLDMVAKSLEYFATRDEKDGKTTNAGKPLAPFKRKDAARARGWAIRVRAQSGDGQSEGEYGPETEWQ